MLTSGGSTFKSSVIDRSVTIDRLATPAGRYSQLAIILYLMLYIIYNS